MNILSKSEKGIKSSNFLPVAIPLLSLVLLTNCTCFQKFENFSLIRNTWIIISIFSAVLNITLSILYEIYIKTEIKYLKLKFDCIKQETEKKYYELIENANREMRIFAHDIENHLKLIRNLENAEEIKRYIDTLLSEVNAFSRTGLSQNKMLDLILSKYLMQCEEKNITFNIDLRTSNLSFIDEVDLSALISNLLDNSVHAAENSTNRQIDFIAFSKNGKYDGIVIRNSCESKPNTKKAAFITNKTKLNLHGLGLLSIHKILNKYNALYDCKYDEKAMIFQTDIVFLK